MIIIIIIIMFLQEEKSFLQCKSNRKIQQHQENRIQIECFLLSLMKRILNMMAMGEQKAGRVNVNLKESMAQTLSRREQECCHTDQTCFEKRVLWGQDSDFLRPASLSQATISKNKLETDPPPPTPNPF